MPRVKRGVTARARHKKVLDLAKGYRGRRSKVWRIAKQAVMRAGQYAYRDRRNKKRVFRALWIARINAAAREMCIRDRIGAGLAKAALAGRLDGELVDTSTVIERDARLAIVTDKDADGLDVIRHSTAHLLAYAVKELFPEAQVTIGPVIDNGFYYDFSYTRPFTPEDLERIEARMRELAARDEAVSREVWDRDDAVTFFRSLGEHYKAEIIGSIPAGQSISLYREGSFIDLCRGPHVPSTGKLKVFKLMKVEMCIRDRIVTSHRWNRFFIVGHRFVALARSYRGLL